MAHMHACSQQSQLLPVQALPARCAGHATFCEHDCCLLVTALQGQPEQALKPHMQTLLGLALSQPGAAKPSSPHGQRAQHAERA